MREINWNEPWKMEFDGWTNVPADETRAFLDSAEFRLVERAASLWGRDHDAGNEPEVLHNGVWKSLCRTDAKDNVATGLVARRELSDWLSHYRNKLSVGARYSDKSYAVIDSYSDG